MSHSAHSLFTQVDISPSSGASQPVSANMVQEAQLQVMKDILAALDRQSEVLTEISNQLGAAQKQRVHELNQWKQANPALARECRTAAEALSRVQTEFLTALTQEVQDNAEGLMDGEFLLTEFVDRFGPRLAHLNGVLQVLSQLGSSTSTPAAGG